MHYGFDNDAGGNKLWQQQMKEAYPRAEAIVRERPPAGGEGLERRPPRYADACGRPGAGGRPCAGREPGLDLITSQGLPR